MPLYEYQCDGKCGQRFEKIQKFSDPPIEKCPNCGGPCHKLLSSPAIQFKGSGWYITDYAKKESTASGKADPGSTASSDKTESKDAKSTAEKADKPAEKKSSTDKTKSS